MIEAIHDWLVFLSLALTLFIPYPFLACPNLLAAATVSIGFLSPGLTWFSTAFADGLPKGLPGSKK